MSSGIAAPERSELIFVLLALAGCAGELPRERLEVVRILPHDPTAYTQGLILHEGRFYESTGQYGASTLREVVLDSGERVRSVELPSDYFGEGLERIGDRLIQLTWREGVALLYDMETFDEVGTFEYEGEGWGLCYDGESLFMTTGGSVLYRRDPTTFAVMESIQIRDRGRALFQVNELACVGDFIYGNVYQTDRIVRIHKRTGEIVAEIDGAVLVPPEGRPRTVDAVLNGIAHDPDSGLFYLTGKLWPVVFEVRVVPE
jgi:glutamine cyclotransferase